uniref:Uncharacterized protein n=1 Tax=Arundo donax TaxID=35708 RepID=A0A0A8YEN8_ARUDO
MPGSPNLHPRPYNTNKCLKNEMMEQHGPQPEETSTTPIFSSKGTGEAEGSKISDTFGKLQQTNERLCFRGDKSTEYLLFDDDYTSTQDDEEALQFIRRSYTSAAVVDIANHLLTVHKLKPHINGGWLFGAVIDAYAHINDMENNYRPVVTTFQSRLLLGKKWIF